MAPSPYKTTLTVGVVLALLALLAASPRLSPSKPAPAGEPRTLGGKPYHIHVISSENLTEKPDMTYGDIYFYLDVPSAPMYMPGTPDHSYSRVLEEINDTLQVAAGRIIYTSSYADAIHRLNESLKELGLSIDTVRVGGHSVAIWVFRVENDAFPEPRDVGNLVYEAFRDSGFDAREIVVIYLDLQPGLSLDDAYRLADALGDTVEREGLGGVVSWITVDVIGHILVGVNPGQASKRSISLSHLAEILDSCINGRAKVRVYLTPYTFTTTYQIAPVGKPAGNGG